MEILIGSASEGREVEVEGATATEESVRSVHLKYGFSIYRFRNGVYPWLNRSESVLNAFRLPVKHNFTIRDSTCRENLKELSKANHGYNSLLFSLSWAYYVQTFTSKKRCDEQDSMVILGLDILNFFHATQ